VLHVVSLHPCRQEQLVLLLLLHLQLPSLLLMLMLPATLEAAVHPMSVRSLLLCLPEQLLLELLPSAGLRLLRGHPLE